MPLDLPGAIIDLSQAQVLVKAFRTQFPEAIKASLIDATLVKQLLNQDGCVGMRIYYGYDSVTSTISPVLVGVDAAGKDMTKGLLLDRMAPCPIVCDVTSDLM